MFSKQASDSSLARTHSPTRSVFAKNDDREDNYTLTVPDKFEQSRQRYFLYLYICCVSFEFEKKRKIFDPISFSLKNVQYCLTRRHVPKKIENREIRHLREAETKCFEEEEESDKPKSLGERSRKFLMPRPQCSQTKPIRSVTIQFRGKKVRMGWVATTVVSLIR